MCPDATERQTSNFSHASIPLRHENNSTTGGFSHKPMTVGCSMDFKLDRELNTDIVM